MRGNGGLQSPGHDTGDHGGAPARKARDGEGNVGLPKLGSRNQHDDGNAGKLAEHWVELLGRRCRDASAQARRSCGGDA